MINNQTKKDSLSLEQDNELTQWWTSYEKDLLRQAQRYGFQKDAAQDIVQDVAILALCHLKKGKVFSGEDEFKRWVKSRLHWLALSYFRTSRHITQEPLDVAAELSILGSQEQGTFLQELIRSADMLPVKQKEVFKRVLVGERPSDIAEELDMSEATVRSNLRFARKRIIDLLLIEG